MFYYQSSDASKHYEKMALKIKTILYFYDRETKKRELQEASPVSKRKPEADSKDGSELNTKTFTQPEDDFQEIVTAKLLTGNAQLNVEEDKGEEEKPEKLENLVGDTYKGFFATNNLLLHRVSLEEITKTSIMKIWNLLSLGQKY